jgi:hypothetical protein
MEDKTDVSDGEPDVKEEAMRDGEPTCCSRWSTYQTTNNGGATNEFGAAKL